MWRFDNDKLRFDSSTTECSGDSGESEFVVDVDGSDSADSSSVILTESDCIAVFGPLALVRELANMDEFVVPVLPGSDGGDFLTSTD